ncbi:hypothetical protein GCM10023321_70860 [Pseudonocardia eucalypti]|uniref:Uncharacterized protein n=1 Tax=Pseudonocardia eucalypti TaxID=648755 RepID=A0ABP9R5M4_9PSEU|nr:hypothetical protein [Pseudonocardia eucalypti]
MYAAPTQRYAKAFAVSLLTAGFLLTTQGSASAEPNCTASHDVRQVGGDWRLDADARCNEKASVRGMIWSYGFWAEPQGGGAPTKFFTSGGDPGADRKRTEGATGHITVVAPRGWSRYCYDVRITYDGPTIYKTEKNEYASGTVCKDAL